MYSLCQSQVEHYVVGNFERKNTDATNNLTKWRIEDDCNLYIYVVMEPTRRRTRQALIVLSFLHLFRPLSEHS